MSKVSTGFRRKFYILLNCALPKRKEHGYLWILSIKLNYIVDYSSEIYMQMLDISNTQLLSLSPAQPQSQNTHYFNYGLHVRPIKFWHFNLSKRELSSVETLSFDIKQICFEKHFNRCEPLVVHIPIPYAAHIHVIMRCNLQRLPCSRTISIFFLLVAFYISFLYGNAAFSIQ